MRSQPPFPNSHEIQVNAFHGSGKDDSRMSDNNLANNEPACFAAEEPFVPLFRNLTVQKNWPLYAFRFAYREYVAELFGTFLLILMGASSGATRKFNDGSYVEVCLGWALALSTALHFSMKISGGHLNPAVTFCNAVFGTFPWRKLPGYILAQVLGAMLGSACMYGLFKPHFDSWKLADGETMTDALGGLFATYPSVANSYACWSEICNTMLLMVGILAILDVRSEPATAFKPLAVGLLVCCIGLCTGINSGWAINPARDFGPRLVSAMIFRSWDPFTKNENYFWIPLVMPCVGALLGMFLYSFFAIPPEKDEAEKTRTS